MRHQAFLLLSALLLVTACKSMVRTPTTDLHAISDGRLTLGVVPSENEEGLQGYRLLLCKNRSSYNKAIFSNPKQCLPALLNSSGQEVVIFHNSLRRSFAAKYGNYVKIAAGVALAAAGVYGGYKWFAKSTTQYYDDAISLGGKARSQTLDQLNKLKAFSTDEKKIIEKELNTLNAALDNSDVKLSKQKMEHITRGQDGLNPQATERITRGQDGLNPQATERITRGQDELDTQVTERITRGQDELNTQATERIARSDQLEIQRMSEIPPSERKIADAEAMEKVFDRIDAANRELGAKFRREFTGTTIDASVLEKFARQIDDNRAWELAELSGQVKNKDAIFAGLLKSQKNAPHVMRSGDLLHFSGIYKNTVDVFDQHMGNEIIGILRSESPSNKISPAQNTAIRTRVQNAETFAETVRLQQLHEEKKLLAGIDYGYFNIGIIKGKLGRLNTEASVDAENYVSRFKQLFGNNPNEISAYRQSYDDLNAAAAGKDTQSKMSNLVKSSTEEQKLLEYPPETLNQISQIEAHKKVIQRYEKGDFNAKSALAEIDKEIQARYEYLYRLEADTTLTVDPNIAKQEENLWKSITTASSDLERTIFSSIRTQKLALLKHEIDVFRKNIEISDNILRANEAQNKLIKQANRLQAGLANQANESQAELVAQANKHLDQANKLQAELVAQANKRYDDLIEQTNKSIDQANQRQEYLVGEANRRQDDLIGEANRRIDEANRRQDDLIGEANRGQASIVEEANIRIDQANQQQAELIVQASKHQTELIKQANQRIDQANKYQAELIEQANQRQDEVVEEANKLIDEANRRQDDLVGEANRRQAELIEQANKRYNSLTEQANKRYDEVIEQKNRMQQRLDEAVKMLGDSDSTARTRLEELRMAADKERLLYGLSGLGAGIASTAMFISLDRSIWGHGEKQMGKHWNQIFMSSDFAEAAMVTNLRHILNKLARIFGHKVNTAALALGN